MRPVSPRFLRSIRIAHQLATRVEVLVDGVAVRELAIDGGSVTLDQSAAQRGRCDIALAGTPDLVPDAPGALLAPYGNELRISRGVTFIDGTIELVPLGVFRIDEPTVDDRGADLTVQIAGPDRSARISDARFEEPYAVSASDSFMVAIEKLLTSGWAEVPFSATWPPPDPTSPAAEAVFEEGGDRWASAQAIATANGHDLFFDGIGEVCLVPTATLSTGDVVETIAEGEGGVLIQATRKWSRAATYNRVVATGENVAADTPPPRGIATDLNPLSPTYYYGRFGRKPRFYSSPFITTETQATDAAAAILARETGTTQSITFGSLVLPYLEPGDVVRVTRPRTGIDSEDHVIDSLTIPLDHAGTMAGATRAIQVT